MTKRQQTLGISGNVQNISLHNNKESCPFCGELANTAEGIFNVTKSILEVMSSPDITLKMIEELSNIAKKSYGKKISPEEAITAASTISPQFGELLTNILSLPTLKKTAILLLLQVLNSCSINLNVDLDVNKLWEQMNGTPPTEIINYKGREYPSKNIKRLAPCTCGSGQYYKQCCGTLTAENLA